MPRTHTVKLLLCHNHYQRPGGEDIVFAAEVELLRRRGHDVVTHTVHNDEIRHMSAARTAARTVWSQESHERVRQLIREHQPDVVHFYNTFPLLSPSVYFAAKAEGRPVVQSVHNYRLLCPNGLFFRDGRVCEDCLGKTLPWPGVVHACYRGDRAATAAVASMLVTHRLAHTWQRQVDVYMAALGEFARPKLEAGGIPADRLVLKPNFIPDPGPGDGRGGYVAFVARLSPEKGVQQVLDTWAALKSAPQLKIIGDGPLAPLVEQAAQRNPAIEWLGQRSAAEVVQILGGAELSICASRWYEGQPRTIVEAFAVGTPVLAPRLGAMQDMIVDGVNGALFEPDVPAALGERAQALFADPARLRSMRSGARDAYLTRYTEDISYAIMLEVYRKAQASHHAR